MNVAPTPDFAQVPTSAGAARAFDVAPGRAYELRLALRRKDGDPAVDPGLTAVDVAFFDGSGRPVSTETFCGRWREQGREAVLVETMPSGADPERCLDAFLASRFVVAPPQSATLRVSPTDPAVETLHAEAIGLAIDWRRDVDWTIGEVEAICATRLEMIRRLHPGFRETEAADAFAAALVRGATRSLAAVAGGYRISGDWTPFLAADAPDTHRADYAVRAEAVRATRAREIRVAFLGDMRSYHRIAPHCDVVLLREDCWSQQLEELDLDLILIQTVSESLIEDWRLAFSRLDGRLSANASALLAEARRRRVPIHVLATVDESGAASYRALLEAADRIVVEGRAWRDPPFPKKTRKIRRGLEPILHPPLRRAPNTGNVLSPAASDVFQFPKYRELFEQGLLGALAFAEFHYGFRSIALAQLLPESVHVWAPSADLFDRAAAIEGASLAFVPNESVRSDGEYVDMLLDLISGGVLPIVYGSPRVDSPLVEALDVALSVAEARELEALYQVPWVWERRWRELFRLICRDHVWSAEDRKTLFGADMHRPDYDAPRVSLICVSKRPGNLPSVRRMLAEQTWSNREVLVVANVDADPGLAPATDGERLFRVSASANIGLCLNHALEIADGDFWAKIDDDDFYSRHYVEELLYFYRATRADMVGRMAVHYYMSGPNQSACRPALFDRTRRLLGPREYVAGSTLSGRRASGLPHFSTTFRNSVDSRWVEDVVAGGFRVAAYDSTSMIVYRDADPSTHSWIKGSQMATLGAGPGNLFERIES